MTPFQHYARYATLPNMLKIAFVDLVEIRSRLTCSRLLVEAFKLQVVRLF